MINFFAKIMILITVLVVGLIYMFQDFLPSASASGVIFEQVARTGSAEGWFPLGNINPAIALDIDDTSLVNPSKYKIFQDISETYYRIYSSAYPFTAMYVLEGENTYKHYLIGSKEPNQTIYRYDISKPGSGFGYGTVYSGVLPSPTGSLMSTTVGEPGIFPVMHQSEIPPSPIGPPINITISDVTSTTATATFTHPSANITRYEIAIASPTMDFQTYFVNRSGTTEQVVYMTGLKPNEITHFFATPYNGDEFADSTQRFFSTKYNDLYSSVTMGQKELLANSTTLVTELNDIVVSTSGYIELELIVNDETIDTYTAGQSVVIPLEDFEDFIDEDTESIIEIKYYKTGSSYDKRSYGLVTELIAYNPIKGGLMPTIPTAPNSAWDVAGWLKYIVDWFLYIVESLVYLINYLGKQIASMLSSMGTLTIAVASVFSFLPPPIIALMGIGLTLIILLRVLGR